jgi:hypothetical protein
VQVFIAGIMQGSRMDHYIGDQDYRRIISETLLEHRADVEIRDPNELHPNGVDYDDELAKATLLEMADLASQGNRARDVESLRGQRPACHHLADGGQLGDQAPVIGRPARSGCLSFVGN